LRSRPLDFRNFDRKKTRVPAWISYGASPTPIPCVLWDVSEGGARITAAHSNILPDMFELILTGNGNARRYCQVVWRRKPHIGIRFIEPSEARVAPRALPADSNRSGYGRVAPES
jgi:PilZ domain-containing protein